jgi:hypothetical protein
MESTSGNVECYFFEFGCVLGHNFLYEDELLVVDLEVNFGLCIDNKSGEQYKVVYLSEIDVSEVFVC